MTSPPSGLANTAGSLRQEMAAASCICQISPTRCQARTRLYRDGKLELDGFPVAAISEYLADGSVTIWLDLRGPDRDDLAVLSEEFGLHPLAVEAALRPSQRPKLDRYRSHLLLTAYGTRLDTGTGDLTTSEIPAFIASKALITVRQEDGLDIGAVVERWDESPDLAKFGVSYLLYGLLDYIVDGQFEAVQSLDDCMEELEDRLFDDVPRGLEVQRRSFQQLPHLQTQGLAVKTEYREAGQFAAIHGPPGGTREIPPSSLHGRLQRLALPDLRHDVTWAQRTHVGMCRTVPGSALGAWRGRAPTAARHLRPAGQSGALPAHDPRPAPIRTGGRPGRA